MKTKETTWARLLACATGLANQELLLQNEYLTAENGIARDRDPGFGPLAGKVFRIGLMGSSSTEENVVLLVDALGKALAAEWAHAVKQ